MFLLFAPTYSPSFRYTVASSELLLMARSKLLNGFCKLPSPVSSLASSDTLISESSTGAESVIISLLFVSQFIALMHDIVHIIDKIIKNSTNPLILLFLIICFSPYIVVKYYYRRYINIYF